MRVFERLREKHSLEPAVIGATREFDDRNAKSVTQLVQEDTACACDSNRMNDPVTKTTKS